MSTLNQPWTIESLTTRPWSIQDGPTAALNKGLFSMNRAGPSRKRASLGTGMDSIQIRLVFFHDSSLKSHSTNVACQFKTQPFIRIRSLMIMPENPCHVVCNQGTFPSERNRCTKASSQSWIFMTCLASINAWVLMINVKPLGIMVSDDKCQDSETCSSASMP